MGSGDSSATGRKPQRAEIEDHVSTADPRLIEHYIGSPETRLRKIRAAGSRIVEDHADALKLLADQDPEDDV